MSWKELVPPTAARSYGVRQASPIMVSVSRFGRSQNYRLVIQTYPQKMEPEVRRALSWWTEGAKVSVKQGMEEDAGQIEITNDGIGWFDLERIGSHPQCPIGVRLNLPSHLPKEIRPRQAVDYSLEPNCLTIYLPKWATQPELSKQFDLLDLISEANRT